MLRGVHYAPQGGVLRMPRGVAVDKAQSLATTQNARKGGLTVHAHQALLPDHQLKSAAGSLGSFLPPIPCLSSGFFVQRPGPGDSESGESPES